MAFKCTKTMDKNACSHELCYYLMKWALPDFEKNKTTQHKKWRCRMTMGVIFFCQTCFSNSKKKHTKENSTGQKCWRCLRSFFVGQHESPSSLLGSSTRHVQSENSMQSGPRADRYKWNVIITPINGLINWFSWGYNPQ